MRFRHFSLIAASLLASACNAGDDRDRERASRDRDEREERVRAPERESESESEARAPEREADENALEPRAQLASSAAPAGNAVSRAWFAGRWTDTGDCAQAGTFNPDGTFRLPDGARGMWNIRDGRLVVQGNEGRNELPLRRIDDDTVEVVNEDGSAGRSIRC